MSVYHSVVVHDDGQERLVQEKHKTKNMYIIYRSEITTERTRLGTLSKVLLIGSFILLFIFLIVSFGEYLYETFGSDPEKSLETYENTSQQHRIGSKSTISLVLTNRFTIQMIAVILLVILGKFFWSEG